MTDVKREGDEALVPLDEFDLDELSAACARAEMDGGGIHDSTQAKLDAAKRLFDTSRPDVVVSHPMAGRLPVLSITCRGYPFVVYAPLTEAGRAALTGLVSSPHRLRIGDHEVTDEELRRGYWNPDEHSA